MASISCILPNNQASSKELEYLFKCDFCPDKFRSEEQFNCHVLEHFDQKNCTMCNKFVIRIGSKWYELHVDDNSDHFNDQQINKALDLDSIVDVKLENCDDSDKLSDLETVNLKYNDDDADFEDEQLMDTEPDEYECKVVTESKSDHEMIESDQKNQTDNTHTSGSNKRKRKERLARTKCRICDRLIINYNFDAHLQKMHVPRIIVPAEPIKCETCGKTFSNPGNLKTHQAIHSGTKRFVCSYCGASFRQLYHLTEHMNAHTGNKPYHCTVCDKRFGRLHILRAHQRIHTGEKPHICTIDGCDRAYAYDIDLKRHKFSAHGIYTKKHICSFCSKVFPENKLLKKHLESHSAGNIRRSLKKPDE